MNYLNAIDFVESPRGLGIPLYPVQRFILKVIFGVPLDYSPKNIIVWDRFKTKNTPFSEPDYLRYCYDEGRCNYADWQDLPGYFNEAAIFLGRRSGKDTLLNLIGMYRLYLLLMLDNPQARYDLVPGSPIDFTTFCLDDDLCDRMKRNFDGIFQNDRFFAPYLRKDRDYRYELVSDHQRKMRNSYADVTYSWYPVSVNMARGPSSIFVGFNELAHMKKADDLYSASTPATCQYHVGGGQSESLIVTMSTTWYKTGKAWDVHNFAMTNDRYGKDIFTIREKTATANPNVPPKSLRMMYERDPKIYKAEFEAEFLDKDENNYYVKKESLS